MKMKQLENKLHILEILKERAAQKGGKIVLPEAQDERALCAAAMIVKDKLAEVVLLGDVQKTQSLAAEKGIDLGGSELLNPSQSPRLEEYAQAFYEKRKEKGISYEQALATLQNPLFYGAMLVKNKLASGMVAGAANTTADVLRAALQVVGVMPGLKTVSSTFIMVSPRENETTYLYSDCAVVPNPTDEQLADIATSTAFTRRAILGDEPRVALLSFSTLGSAEHELVEKVRSAKAILSERKVDFAFEGELQLDAAIVERVAKSKAPNSSVAGKANTLIFPDLQSGNIGYKLTQRLAGYEAIGPIIQGLAAPICDLSRGCSIQDIYNTAILVLLMSK